MGNTGSQVLEDIRSVPAIVPVPWKKRRSLKIGGGPAIGIDLGTTNCCVAVWRNGGVEMIRSEDGGTIVPSCVAFPPSGGYLVGGVAKDQALENVANTLFHVKRCLGRKFDDVDKNASMCLWPYKIVRGSDKEGEDSTDCSDCRIEVEQKDGEKLLLTPEKVSSFILIKLKEMAEDCLGCPVTNAVVAVPANFTQAQKQATKNAANIAGLNVIRLITESSAAAFAYAVRTNNDKQNVGGGVGGGGGVGVGGGTPKGMTMFRRWVGGPDGAGGQNSGGGKSPNDYDLSKKTVMVVDWGGGTFDVSVMKVARQEFRVIATAGDCQLGGQDVDDAMVTHFALEIDRTHGLPILENPRALRRVRANCEKLKHKLSSCEHYVLIIDALFNGNDFRMEMTRETLEELCAPLFQRCMALVGRALDDSGIDKSEIGKLILAGGSMRMPKIQEMLKVFFGNDKLSKVINPDECIAYGAAVQAALLTGDASLNVLDLEVVEAVPVSIGFSDARGNFVRVINRNRPFPTRVVESNVRTPFDGRTVGTVSVYEGERDKADENEFLGDIVIDGLKPGPPGSGNEKVPLEIIFEIDEDGILATTLKDKLTGRYASRSFGRKWGQCTNDEGRTAAKIASNVAEEDRATVAKSTARWRFMEYVHRLKWRLNVMSDQASKARMRNVLDAEEKWLTENEQNLFEVSEYDSRLQRLMTTFGHHSFRAN